MIVFSFWLVNFFFMERKYGKMNKKDGDRDGFK